MQRQLSIRERLRDALRARPCTARDLSEIAGIPEHDVAAHLGHLRRSLKHLREVLIIEPASCLDCGFVFSQRERYTRPSGCPRCRGRRISLPQFRIAPRG